MKKHVFTLVCAGALVLASTASFGQQMDSNMPGMQATKPTQVQGVGIVKAIDTTKGTITLQHQAITAIGWPAMTMTFKADPSDLLQNVKVGEQVRFTLHLAGMGSTVTAIAPVQP
ncbi:copper-binding protein [Rhodanobacter terrae]|uniref:Copper-binding protein n=1 Tax=Rhodanobacter terrae TaxID=418647 RepID=A0ABW0SXM3_9GAMM